MKKSSKPQSRSHTPEISQSPSQKRKRENQNSYNALSDIYGIPEQLKENQFFSVSKKIQEMNEVKSYHSPFNPNSLHSSSYEPNTSKFSEPQNLKVSITEQESLKQTSVHHSRNNSLQSKSKHESQYHGYNYEEDCIQTNLAFRDFLTSKKRSILDQISYLDDQIIALEEETHGELTPKSSNRNCSNEPNNNNYRKVFEQRRNLQKNSHRSNSRKKKEKIRTSTAVQTSKNEIDECDYLEPIEPRENYHEVKSVKTEKVKKEVANKKKKSVKEKGVKNLKAARSKTRTMESSNFTTSLSKPSDNSSSGDKFNMKPDIIEIIGLFNQLQNAITNNEGIAPPVKVNNSKKKSSRSRSHAY